MRGVSERCCAPVTARKGDRPRWQMIPGCQMSPGELCAAAFRLKAAVRADLKFLDD